jgi:hypothetical protein
VYKGGSEGQEEELHCQATSSLNGLEGVCSAVK